MELEKDDEFFYLNKINELFENYVKSEDKSNLKKEILTNIKLSGRFDVGRTICESSEDLYKEINLLENEVMATRSLNRYNGSLNKNSDAANKVLLEMIAQTALSMCEDSETNIVNEDKKLVWFNIFKDIKEFSRSFEETFEYWKNWREENIKKYVNEHNKIKQNKTVDEFSVIMPIELNVREMGEYKKIGLENLNEDLTNKLIKDFNEFQLDAYMDLSYINKLTLNKEGDNWEFKVECNKEVSEKDKAGFIEDLVGQIVDGWGESQEQKYKLIGNKEYNLYFDYKNANIKNKFKSRNKIK
jgi:hypothetical protein